MKDLLYRPRLQLARFIDPRSRRDPELARMIEVARDVDAKAFSGGWVNVLNYEDMTSVPAAVNTYTAIAAITTPTAIQPCLPANSLAVGTVLRIRATGSIGSAAGTATFVLSLMLGTASGTLMASTAAQTPPTSTVGLWKMDTEFVITARGSGGAMFGGGTVVGLGATPATVVLMPTTLASVAVNTTQANAITLCGTWSASAAGNTTTVYTYSIEQLN